MPVHKLQRNSYTALVYFLTCCLLFLLVVSLPTKAQYQVTGSVRDKKTHDPLPFAVITYNGEGRGDLADVQGNFQIRAENPIRLLGISHVGYRTKTVKLATNDSVQTVNILLESQRKQIAPVVITPTENPAVTLLKRSLEQKTNTNPNLLPRYTYLNYNKLRIAVEIDSTDSSDEDFPAFKQLNDSLSDHYLFFISESLARHDHKRGAPAVDVILSNRTSGFKDPKIFFLASMLQPLSFYDESIEILTQKYANPYSLVGIKNYRYQIRDTILLPSGDTLFQIHFTPRNSRAVALTGSIAIGSKSLALEKIDINLDDEPNLGLVYTLNHRYKQDSITKRWFPDELYISLHDSTQSFRIETTTLVKDVQTEKIVPLNNSRSISISYEPIEEKERDSILQRIQIPQLNIAEHQAYQIMDSLGDKYKFDKWLAFAETLTTGRLALGYLQIVLPRLAAYNEYEGNRLGLGLETTNKFSRYFQLGGYYAYGFRDRGHKFGFECNLWGDKKTGQKFQLCYSNDLRHAGDLQALGNIPPLQSILLNIFHYIRMDREQRYSVAWAMQRPLEMQLTCSYIDHQNYSQWGYPQAPDAPYSLALARLAVVYAPFNEYAYFPSGLFRTRTSPLQIQFQLEHAARVRHWEQQFTKGELLFQVQKVSVSSGNWNLLLRGGTILGDYPLSYGYTNQGINSMTYDYIDPESFFTIRNDVYYHDLYAYLHLRYSTIPWFAIHLSKSWRFGLLACFNAGWGTQLKAYEQRYGINLPTMRSGVLEGGLGIALIPLPLGLIATYRIYPFEKFQYKQNFGIEITAFF